MAQMSKPRKRLAHLIGKPIRASIYFPEGLWLALKLAAVNEKIPVSELVERACEEVLKKRKAA